jgi:HTH-type transcriptional regulator, competence development regulator
MRFDVPKRLADELKTLRAMRKLSLREVEEQTRISNAYLSQLERGEAENPSPDKLQRLARCYGVPYESLMKAAGYLRPVARGGKKPDLSRLQMALMSADLTEEEEEQLLKYLRFIRFGK